MENLPNYKLKYGLSQIKKDFSNKVGPVSKYKKADSIAKLKELKYSYNEKKDALITDSMYRKKSVINLNIDKFKKKKK